MATAALSQGPALSQAGTDLLRSKSLDRNSYDSGDWFNAIHWDCADGNGFGTALPARAAPGGRQQVQVAVRQAAVERPASRWAARRSTAPRPRTGTC